MLARFPGFGVVALGIFPDLVSGRYQDAGWKQRGSERSHVWRCMGNGSVVDNEETAQAVRVPHTARRSPLHCWGAPLPAVASALRSGLPPGAGPQPGLDHLRCQRLDGLDDPGTAGRGTGGVRCGTDRVLRGAATRQQHVDETVLTSHERAPQRG